MNCTNLKLKLNKKLYCNKYNMEIQLSACKNCKMLEYAIKEQKKLQSNKPIKKVSKKQTKLEKDRFSIIVNDLKHCYYHEERKAHPHEIYCGRNRKNSIKYGLCIGLCNECHTKHQNNTIFNDYWHIRGQKKFIEYYPAIRFETVFKINYL